MKISAENVCIAIDKKEIVKSVSLCAGKGEFIGIIGPNGCGKSTLLKSLYRTLKPTSGAVFLDTKNMSEYSVKESAKKMSVVAQHNYYSFDFTVEEVVLMGRTPHKKSMQRYDAQDYKIAQESLKAADMEGFAGRNFSTLSGGEGQRVILARALAQNTPCIIMDEPTNHLDIKHQLEIMSIVKSLGRTVISAIHDLNIAAMYCDRLYALKAGQIVCSGKVEEVLTVDMIKKIFGVDAEIIYNEAGEMRILYKMSRP